MRKTRDIPKIASSVTLAGHSQCGGTREERSRGNDDGRFRIMTAPVARPLLVAGEVTSRRCHFRPVHIRSVRERYQLLVISLSLFLIAKLFCRLSRTGIAAEAIRLLSLRRLESGECFLGHAALK